MVLLPARKTLRALAVLSLSVTISGLGTAGLFGLFSRHAALPARAEPGENFFVEGYRVFANADSTDVGAPLAGEDAMPTVSGAGTAFRLRLTVRPEDVSAAAPLPNPAFLRFAYADDIDNGSDVLRLQFAPRVGGACGGGDEIFEDFTGVSDIRFFDNASVADDALLTSNANDPDNDRTETYNEDALFTADDSPVTDGQNTLWDFSLETNGANPGTVYCFQVSDDTGGDVDMNVIPAIRIASLGGSGSGGGLSCPFVSGTFLLADGAQTTGSRDISVVISHENATEAVISEHPFFVGAEFQTIPENGTIPFTLSEGLGEKTVYVLLRNRCSQTPVTSASIQVAEAEEPAPAPELPAEEEGDLSASTVLACDATRLEWFAELPTGAKRVIDATTAKIEVLSAAKTLYRFEDNVDSDFNDLVFTVDLSDCLRPALDLFEADAGWDHRVGVRYFLDGTLVGERILQESSRLAVLDKRGPVFSEFPTGETVGLSGELE